MGATMETQPTQLGLMKIFTSPGLAKDNSLTAIEGHNSDGKAFAGLLSGYLSNDAENSMMANPEDDLSNLTALADDSLPLSGQALPLELISPPLASPVESFSLSASGGGPAEQDFYAQSLVSSLIASATNSASATNAVSATNSASATNATSATNAASAINLSSITGESAKMANVTPQKMANDVNLQNLTASELEAMSAETADRFLGSESMLHPLRSKKSGAIELLPASQNIAPLNSPNAMETKVSLALALNEDPTTQSMGDLIDVQAMEKDEVDTKLNTLERKQDDQTLKLSKGQQAWGDAITARITMNAAQDVKQVTIHLDPPELGTLELKLHVKDDQQTLVQVNVQHPQVKEALESSAHRLREMLADHGLELSEFDVQTDSDRREQLADDSDKNDQGQSQNSDTSPQSDEEMSIEIPKAKNNNLLDTFV
jgi:flagellar hook-length control protein FliK